MTLRELIAQYPEMFAAQTWFADEAFMDVDLLPLSVQPVRTIPAKTVPDEVFDELTDTVLLAHCYVRDPSNPIWHNYLWTADVDRYGQRIYIGDPHRLGKLEIHRHLIITYLWRIPVFA